MKQRTNGEMWTEQDGKDASRLLAELAKRADKATRPAGEIPAPIQIDRTCPSSPVEKAAGRLEGLQRPAAVIATILGGSGGSGTVIANGDGRLFSEVSRLRNANDNRPSDREDGVSEDRAVTRSRFD
jgi:hypothetical protein